MLALHQLLVCPALGLKTISQSMQAYTAIDEGEPLDQEVFQQFFSDPVHKVRTFHKSASPACRRWACKPCVAAASCNGHLGVGARATVSCSCSVGTARRVQRVHDLLGCQ